MMKRIGVLAPLAAVLLAGCSYLPFFGSDDFKPGPLPEFRAKANASVIWQNTMGSEKRGFAPRVAGKNVFAAAPDGTVASFDLESGRLNWRAQAPTPLSAGPGSDGEVVVVANAKGAIYAFGAAGKAMWTAQVSSEVLAPPAVADGMVVVWAGDGRIFGFASTTGERKWVQAFSTPALTLRSHASGVAVGGGIISGLPGGKLIVMDINTGTIGWETSIATPKGTTELERIADVTSPPVVEGRQVCAVAYQGRVGCFDILRGTLNWSRDISSFAGLVADARNIYLTDDKGNVQAMDKSTGASVWKQDKLAKRQPSAPQIAGDYLAVIDAEGYVHLIDRSDGALIGRAALDGAAAVAPALATGDGIIALTRKGLLARLRTQ